MGGASEETARGHEIVNINYPLKKNLHPGWWRWKGEANGLMNYKWLIKNKSRIIRFKNELFNLRFQLATGQLDNPMRIKAERYCSY